MELAEHNKWLNSQQFNLMNASSICQCETEREITHSPEPELMRAELLSYVFLDQFLYTYYPFLHADFKIEFPGLTLAAHLGNGPASPSWFIWSNRGYDVNANWQLIQPAFRDYLVGGLEWLRRNGGVEEDNYWALAKKEIAIEFEEAHQTEFMKAVEHAL